MKRQRRPIRRGEWIAIGAPLVALGIYAVGWGRWRANRPAVLDPSPVPLHYVLPSRDGRWIVGLGHALDAKNRLVVSAPWIFARWNAAIGHLDSQINESREVQTWAITPDGDALGLAFPGPAVPTTTLVENKTYSLVRFQPGAGTVEVRRFATGETLAAWSLKGSSFGDRMRFSPDKRELLLLTRSLQWRDARTGRLLKSLDPTRIFGAHARVENALVSPDGHTLALLGAGDGAGTFAKFTPDAPPSLGAQSAQTSAPGYGLRVAFVSFPSLRLLWRAPGDGYTDCDWGRDGTLLAVASLHASFQTQKLVVARLDPRTQTTRWQTREMLNPTKQSSYSPNSPKICGATGAVLMRDGEGVTVWNAAGNALKVLSEPRVTLPPGALSPPSVWARPLFSSDGRFVLRVQDSLVERYTIASFVGASSTP